MPSTGTTRRITRFAALPFDEDDSLPLPPVIGWNPYEPMPSQAYSWSCSACALAWVLRSTGLNPNATEYTEVQALGYCPNCAPGCGVSSSLGLCDSSGSALRRVYSDYGLETLQAWLDFDTVYNLAEETTGQMSGVNWYHWVALRGVQGNNLWIANSAPGYKGVYDVLSRADFQRLGGFSVVYLV